MRKKHLSIFVQNLSPSERQFFTTNACNTTNYYKLYRYLNRRNDHDGHRFRELDTKDNRRELYKKLVRILRGYKLQSNAPRKFEVKRLIIDATILLDKGLRDKPKKLLLEAKGIAQSIHSYLEIIQVNNLLLEINYLTPSKKKIQEGILYLLEDNAIQQELLNEYFAWLSVYNYMHNLRMKEGANIEANYRKKIEEVEEKEFKSELARFRFLQSKAILYKILGQTDKVVEFNRRMLAWWGDNEDYKKGEYKNFLLTKINCLNVLATDCQVSPTDEKKEEIEDLLRDIRGERRRNFNELSYKVETAIQIAILNVYMITKNYRDGKILLERLRQEEGHTLENMCILEYSYISVLFNLEEFEEAVRYARAYLRRPSTFDIFGEIYRCMPLVIVASLTSLAEYTTAEIEITNYLKINKKEGVTSTVCRLMIHLRDFKQYESKFGKLTPEEKRARKKVKDDLKTFLSSHKTLKFADDLSTWMKSLH